MPSRHTGGAFFQPSRGVLLFAYSYYQFLLLDPKSGEDAFGLRLYGLCLNGMGLSIGGVRQIFLLSCQPLKLGRQTGEVRQAKPILFSHIGGHGDDLVESLLSQPLAIDKLADGFGQLRNAGPDRLGVCRLELVLDFGIVRPQSSGDLAAHLIEDGVADAGIDRPEFQVEPKVGEEFLATWNLDFIGEQSDLRQPLPDQGIVLIPDLIEDLVELTPASIELFLNALDIGGLDVGRAVYLIDGETFGELLSGHAFLAFSQERRHAVNQFEGFLHKLRLHDFDGRCIDLRLIDSGTAAEVSELLWQASSQ